MGFGQNSLSFSLDSPAESVAGSEGRDENVSLNRDGDDQLQQRQTGVRVAEDAGEGAGNTAHTNIDLGEVSAQGVTQKQLEEVQGQMVAVMTRQMAALQLSMQQQQQEMMMKLTHSFQQQLVSVGAGVQGSPTTAAAPRMQVGSGKTQIPDSRKRDEQSGNGRTLSKAGKLAFCDRIAGGQYPVMCLRR